MILSERRTLIQCIESLPMKAANPRSIDIINQFDDTYG